MLQDIVVPAGVVLLSELADKTQLLIITLSSRHGRALELFLAALLAFLLVDGAAVLLGSVASDFLPTAVLKAAAALLFIVLGVKMLAEGEEQERRISAGSGFGFFFPLLFLSEFGDKSQLAALLLSTQFNPWLAMAGIMAALGAMTAGSILIGKAIARVLDPKVIKVVAAAAFVVVGVWMLV